MKSTFYFIFIGTVYCQLYYTPRHNEVVVYQDDEYIEIDLLAEETKVNKSVFEKASKGGRGLQEDAAPRTGPELFNLAKTRSNFCKNECIRKDLIFCPGDNYLSGYCCS